MHIHHSLAGMRTQDDDFEANGLIFTLLERLFTRWYFNYRLLIFHSHGLLGHKNPGTLVDDSFVGGLSTTKALNTILRSG